MARKTSKTTATITTGFSNGNWERVFQDIADARNSNRPKARKLYDVLVEHFTFNIHSIRGGKTSAKPLAQLELPRTKAAIERAASEWAKANPGKPFQVVYEGWFDGTECLPRYNSPVKPSDRVEKVVVFSLPVYTHTGVGEVRPSDAEVASKAVMVALASQK